MPGLLFTLVEFLEGGQRPISNVIHCFLIPFPADFGICSRGRMLERTGLLRHAQAVVFFSSWEARLADVLVEWRSQPES